MCARVGTCVRLSACACVCNYSHLSLNRAKIEVGKENKYARRHNLRVSVYCQLHTAQRFEYSFHKFNVPLCSSKLLKMVHMIQSPMGAAGATLRTSQPRGKNAAPPIPYSHCIKRKHVLCICLFFWCLSITRVCIADENAGVNTAPQSAFKTTSRIPTKGSRLFAPLHSSHNKMPS